MNVGKRLLFVFFFSIFFNGISQEKIEILIEWEAPMEVLKNEKTFKIPRIKNQEYNYNQPNFYWIKKLDTDFEYEFELVNYSTEEAKSEDIALFQNENIKSEDIFNPQFLTKRGGWSKYLVASFLPYVVENGKLMRVVKINGQLHQIKKLNKPIPKKSFASQSVLREGSGTWYKISVSSDGIYKIDKAFLESCGINTDGLNPAHINIFGNGEGMLPEDNAIFRTDDLAKNAIHIVGGEDGVFDETDYILFYGWGPHQWKANGLADFDRKTNTYEDVSYYFININENETASRIMNLSSSSATPTTTITQMNSRLTWEKENTNLVSAGQRWYGEEFDINLSQYFSFSIPNVVTDSPAKVKTAMASSARDSGSSVKGTANGTTLLNGVLAPAGEGNFGRNIYNVVWANPSSSLNFNLTVNRNNPSVTAYLDFITINARRSLVFYGNEMSFRDLASVGMGSIGKFVLSNVTSDVFVWDITDRHNPKKIETTSNGSELTFTLPTEELREFVASNGQTFAEPKKVGAVDYQNLHGLPNADLLIVTPKSFSSQANRLANLHREEGMVVHVVTQDQIFNEFSSGMRDATAIRYFAKMFYDRSQSATPTLKNMLLFGDGTYDHRNKKSNANYIMTYQVENSEDHINALVSDDYFALLDDDDAFRSTDLVDIGIGRLLISSDQIAKEQVDKIEHYMRNGSSFYSSPGDCNCNPAATAQTFGDWRMKYAQISDDYDSKNHYDFVVSDLEKQVDLVDTYRNELNVEKIYSDAYQQISVAGGQRYPGVNEAITDRIQRGALVMNYVGHGGEAGAADERIITIPQINSWKNANALPLFVTATCEFTKYDDPSRVSAGEWISLNPKGGAIALMTTTRSVYFGVNTETGLAFYDEVFKREVDSLPRTFGKIMMETKNLSGNSDNKRSFTLIGDPAIRLALPHLKAKADSIYREGNSVVSDTLRALDKITLVGHFEDLAGNILTDFNGIATPTIFDKPKLETTLGQDPGSSKVPFLAQKNALFKGQVSVINGYYKMTFIVPKDINYEYGHGKISMYGFTTSVDAMGADTSVIIGGVNPNGINDNQGPNIDLYLNDFSFVNGGLTNETPILIAKLFDENGINAVGNGIGHDLNAVIDANSASPILLNEYYLSDLNTYKSGVVNYNLSKLEPGKHTLTFRAWDVNNNSSEKTIEFTVQEKATPELSHVLNYPNPFTTKTKFYFEHNQVNTALETQIQIFTITGKVVKTINSIVTTQGFRSEGIEWDGLDDFGDQLAKGVYVYRLSIKTATGGTAEKIEKLVILK